jgi:flagellar biosynthesis anti-sigma factor FlgM
MKIEVNSPAISLVAVDKGAKKVSNGSLAGTQEATVDRTSFSTDTQSVQALTTQAMSSPEIRQDKVDALSQAVSSGEYKPDASKTADAIVANHGD